MAHFLSEQTVGPDDQDCRKQILHFTPYEYV